MGSPATLAAAIRVRCAEAFDIRMRNSVPVLGIAGDQRIMPTAFDRAASFAPDMLTHCSGAFACAVALDGEMANSSAHAVDDKRSVTLDRLDTWRLI